MFQFNRHCRHRWFPCRSVLAFFGQRITDLDTDRYSKWSYHVNLEPAHTILAQACMSVLLQVDDHAEENGVEKRSPLAKYAAEHWVSHAQFQSVSSSLRKAMGYLFDPDKPYFTAWLQIHDIDSGSQLSSLNSHSVGSRSGATPLYYAALCGFQGLVENLIMKYPQHVNAYGGYLTTPLVVASAKRHFQTAELFISGADVDVRGRKRRTPLHSAAWYGGLEMVRVLLNYKVDVNARSDLGWTPIHYVSLGFSVIRDMCQLFPDVALLEHGADVNAEVSGSDGSGRTPSRIALEKGCDGIMKLLSEHGAK